MSKPVIGFPVIGSLTQRLLHTVSLTYSLSHMSIGHEQVWKAQRR